MNEEHVEQSISVAPIRDVQTADAIEPTPTEQVGEHAAAFMSITERELQGLAALGMHVRKEGVSKVICGMALLHQKRLDGMIQILSTTILRVAQKKRKSRADDSSIAQLTTSLGHLSAKLTDSQRLMLSVEKLGEVGEEPENLNKSFEQGEIVEIPEEMLARQLALKISQGRADQNQARDGAVPRDKT